MKTDEESSTMSGDHEVTLGEVARTTMRIERKLDGLSDDHERRLRALERWMWGAIALGGAGSAAAINQLVHAVAGGGL
jgi:hypothetical protein